MHRHVRTIAAALMLAAAFFPGARAMAEDAPPEDPNKPRQVTVTVKIIEFQASKGVETGFSAYFRRREKTDFWGVVKPPRQGLMTADLTFPSSTAAGITVFLDRLRLNEGDLEMVLQALVDENRATIVSQPKIMVMRGGGKNRINTTQQIPYENTSVVGATTVQTTEFRETGVSLEIEVPDIVDIDGDWRTTEDTFIELHVNAQVSEEGQRIVIALDDSLAAGSDFSLASNAISAPEFVTRNIITQVYVRHGQVLVLGGLFSNSNSTSLSTAPWLTQAEDMAVGLAEWAVPGDFLMSPVSATVGNREKQRARRELVFFIKAEVWRPAFTVVDERAFDEDDAGAHPPRNPKDVLTDVIEGLSTIPEDLQRKSTDPDKVGPRLGGGQ